MKIVQLNADSNAEATSYVQSKNVSKLCHLPRWNDVIEESIGCDSFYLTAIDGGRIYGVLPLTHVRGRLFGNRLVSQGLSNYGGVLADDSAIEEALLNRAIELGGKTGCKSVEIRSIDPLGGDFYCRTDKICMHLALPGDPEDLWNSFLPKVRNQVRKAEKSGIVAQSGGEELLNDFYRVYSIRMHQLGTPAYSPKIMAAILKFFPDITRIFVVRRNQLTLGAAFTWRYNGLVEIPWAATLQEYNRLSPNNLLYWAVLKYYCAEGLRCFDFGRCSVGGNSHRFKKQWGPETVQLYYHYWSVPGEDVPIVSPDNPKYRRRVEMWKKLPFWTARLIGPRISRQML